MVDTTTGVLGLPNIFWAPGTDPSGEGLSYEQLKQRRAIAAALASRSRPYPTTIGQGIASLGESFGDAMYERRTQEYEKAQRELDRKASESASGGTVTTPPPPAAPRGRTSAVTEEAVKTAAALDEQPNPVSTMVADASPASRADLARSVLVGQGIAPPGAAGVSPEPIPSRPSAAPLRTRYAALNTGPTMSDAGQPGATYGGPSPAGPGASMAEPPDTAPPTPSASPIAPSGPAGTPASAVAGGGPAPVPRAALAGPVMAQAGVTPPVPGRPPPAPAAPPAPAPLIRPAPGTLTQPPAAGARPPQTYPERGQTQMMEPRAAKPRPEQPLIGQDTPEMARIKTMLADPQYRNISPSERTRWTGILERETAKRDKQDAEKLDAWRRKDADWFTGEQKRIDENQNLPKTRLELSEKTDAETIRREFGSEDAYKAALTEAKDSAASAKAYADGLKNLNQAINIVKHEPIVSGAYAHQGPGLHTPWGSLALPSEMTWRKIIGTEGYKKEVENTETFRAYLRPMMRAMMGQTTGPGAVSDKEVDQAAEALGLKQDMNRESILNVLENWKHTAFERIRDHNQKVDSVFDPTRHGSTHRQYKVEITPDPMDVLSLRSQMASPEAIAEFDQRYGAGAAQKVLAGR